MDSNLQPPFLWEVGKEGAKIEGRREQTGMGAEVEVLLGGAPGALEVKSEHAFGEKLSHFSLPPPGLECGEAAPLLPACAEGEKGGGEEGRGERGREEAAPLWWEEGLPWVWTTAAKCPQVRTWGGGNLHSHLGEAPDPTVLPGERTGPMCRLRTVWESWRWG